MRTRVFVSCGQRGRERMVAEEVRQLLERRGFDPYVAINAQTILEINAGIIGELKNSDCYLFVNFRREQIDHGHRGSLFSHQEAAIAYALGFERILVINQVGVLREGVLGYVGINTEEFNDFNDCCAVVERALDRSGWTPDYSRRLDAANLRFSDAVLTFANLIGRFLYVDINNGRPDVAALEATARLSAVAREGERLQPSPIRSPLKATARPGFSHTIFPKSHEAFDLLCVGSTRSPNAFPSNVTAATGMYLPARTTAADWGVFLNSALDVVGAGRLPVTTGVWMLQYEFYAIGFPLLSVLIELNVANWETPAATIVSQETAR